MAIRLSVRCAVCAVSVCCKKTADNMPENGAPIAGRHF
jgi:hypothetical protein